MLYVVGLNLTEYIQITKFKFVPLTLKAHLSDVLDYAKG